MEDHDISGQDESLESIVAFPHHLFIEAARQAEIIVQNGCRHKLRLMQAQYDESSTRIVESFERQLIEKDDIISHLNNEISQLRCQVADTQASLDDSILELDHEEDYFVNKDALRLIIGRWKLLLHNRKRERALCAHVSRIEHRRILRMYFNDFKTMYLSQVGTKMQDSHRDEIAKLKMEMVAEVEAKTGQMVHELHLLQRQMRIEAEKNSELEFRLQKLILQNVSSLNLQALMMFQESGWKFPSHPFQLPVLDDNTTLSSTSRSLDLIDKSCQSQQADIHMSSIKPLNNLR